MLTKMLPEQVSKFWDVIKYAVSESLPPIAGEHPDTLNRVLAAALAGRADVWTSYVREGDTAKFEGIVITRILYDDVSDTKNLLIYCIYGYVQVDEGSWLEGIRSLLKYARSKGCLQVVAYTSAPYIVNKARSVGATSDYHFISFNVEELIQKLG